MELAGSECKKEGEKCLKDGKYFEAMLHFTKGVKYDPYNPNIYLGRSESFLRIQQFYYALDDAKAVIRLLPKWPKGYLRKAEVECAAECFADAVTTLKQGLEAYPGEVNLQNELQKANEQWKKQRTAESRMPWFGISLGLISGLVLIVLDEAISKKPLLQDDYIRSLTLVGLITICYALAWLYRYMIQSQRTSLIEAPIDLLGENSTESTDASNSPSSSSPPSRNSKRK